MDAQHGAPYRHAAVALGEALMSVAEVVGGRRAGHQLGVVVEAEGGAVVLEQLPRLRLERATAEVESAGGELDQAGGAGGAGGGDGNRAGRRGAQAVDRRGGGRGRGGGTSRHGDGEGDGEAGGEANGAKGHGNS